MSKKENKSNGLIGSLGEINTIRDILMGQEISNFNEKFKRLEKRIDKLEKELKEKTELLKAQTKQEVKVLSKEFGQQITHVEHAIQKQTEAQIKKVEKTTNKERIVLAKLFSDLSKRLLE
ncbi:MAG TPA: hypothetical protein ENK52_06060 [Saprospiraceae bacterium]|nr:hypothetical protein [Saprospiraceae bacterium]